MAGGVSQAADDMVRIISNGLTFGLADRAASALGEQDTAAKTAAARDRAGLAGDIASVVGLGGGAKAALKGVGAIPKIAKAVFSKSGALAAGLGLGSLVQYNSRTGDAEAQPAPAPATPAAAATPKGKKADPNAMAGQIMTALQNQQSGPPTFADLVGHVAASQGGKISLRQLGALGQAAQQGSTADYYARGGASRPIAPGDSSGRLLEQMNIARFQKALQDPNADATKAAQDFEEKTLQLRKTQFIDPYGLHDGGE